MNLSTKTHFRHALLLSLSLSVVACNAQKPAPTAASTPAAATTAQPVNAPQFSEPGLTGRIVDLQTKQPIEGAIVYGYYATAEGSLGGGEKIVQGVKSFETKTDANGVFKLDAWDTGSTPIRGLPRSHFPMISIYKPGYRLDHQNLKSIADWQPNSDVVGKPQRSANSGYDWTPYRYLLRPVANERDRYFALSDSSVGTMYMGECGWEAYAGLLLAQHREWKDFLKRNIPSDGLDARGYKKSAYSHPDRDLALSHESFIDRTITNSRAAGNSWRCLNPENLLNQGSR